MRLRALVAMAMIFSVAPAVPALAEDAPAPPAASASATSPPPATPPPATPPDDGTAGGTAPPPGPPAPADEGQGPPGDGETPAAPVARPKLEAGLAGDGDGTRVIVELAAPAEAAPVAGEARSLPGAEVVLEPADTSFIVVEATGESLARLAEDPRVRSIRRDRVYSPVALGSPGLLSSLGSRGARESPGSLTAASAAASLASSLQVIGADRAHAAGTRGQGQTIAIIDTGIDADHPDLGGKVVEQACFSATDDGARSLCPNGQTGDPASADAETPACVDGQVNLCDHGTHVAGIAHAVAPDADIVALQVFSRVDDCDGTGAACLTAFESTILLALEHVAKLKEGGRNIAAVNMSLGGGLYEGACDTEPELSSMKGRVDDLRARGVAVVAAAGNEGVAGAGAPGCFSAAVTVGATGDDDTVPAWSNHGSVLDLFAPGLEIDSAVPGGGHQVYSGTSMSAPFVTGALALAAQKAPGTPDALAEVLTKAGRPIVHGTVTTPRLDLNAALAGGTPGSPVTPPPPAADDPGDPGDPPSAPPADDPGTDPSPEPSSGPSPTVTPDDPVPSPIPLPTVTITVTVTVPAPGAPRAGAPAVCTRGSSTRSVGTAGGAGAARTTRTLTAAQWATEMTRGKGTIPDATLGCYLGLVGKASKVFPEVTPASSLATAYRVLKPAKRTARAAMERELLASWLNWANGAVNLTATIKGRTTLKVVLTSVEGQRLKGSAPAASTSLLKKRVNARRAA
ncbi:S8 family serine peptidase [Streptosporangium sp. NPDC023615]|uniref:S8 family peptidase n=1 Tax=Streptosporangium sp. NPDC023615 TaxID=3154794 RepID=UPI003442FBC7